MFKVMPGWARAGFRATSDSRKKGPLGLASDLGNGQDVLGLAKCSVRGRNPLEFSNLTTPFPMRAGLVLNKQLAAQTGTLIKEIQVRLNLLPGDRCGYVSSFFAALAAND